MTEQALAAGVGRPEQYSTVYSGMDVDAFLNPPRPRDEVRRELGLADDEVAFATVARLFERKGHDDILAAAPAVLAANPEGPVRLHRRRDLARAAEGRGRAARGRPRDPLHRPGPARPDPRAARGDRRRGPPQPPRRAGPGLAPGPPGRPAGDQLRRRRRPRGRPSRDGHPAPAPATSRASRRRSSAWPPTRASATSMGREGRRRFADQFRHETMTEQLRSLYERLLGRDRPRGEGPAPDHGELSAWTVRPCSG